MPLTDNKGRNLKVVPLAADPTHQAVLAVTLVDSDGVPVESPIQITVPNTPGTYTYTIP
jgi:hypothetical protein